MVGAPVDRGAPELEALDAPAAALRGGERSRGAGGGEVGGEGEGGEEEEEGEGDEAAPAAGARRPAAAEGGGEREGEGGGRHWPGRRREGGRGIAQSSSSRLNHSPLVSTRGKKLSPTPSYHYTFFFLTIQRVLFKQMNNSVI